MQERARDNLWSRACRLDCKCLYPGLSHQLGPTIAQLPTRPEEAARPGMTGGTQPRPPRRAPTGHRSRPTGRVRGPVGMGLRGLAGMADAARGRATQSDLARDGLEKRRGSGARTQWRAAATREAVAAMGLGLGCRAALPVPPFPLQGGRMWTQNVSRLIRPSLHMPLLCTAISHPAAPRGPASRPRVNSRLTGSDLDKVSDLVGVDGWVETRGAEAESISQWLVRSSSSLVHLWMPIPSAAASPSGPHVVTSACR
eukprot:353906-Chlamydomonas_euryale.AAC.2